ncbi:unnamed protein product, partial [Urochloa humidicola]
EAAKLGSRGGAAKPGRSRRRSRRRRRSSGRRSPSSRGGAPAGATEPDLLTTDLRVGAAEPGQRRAGDYSPTGSRRMKLSGASMARRGSMVELWRGGAGTASSDRRVEDRSGTASLGVRAESSRGGTASSGGRAASSRGGAGSSDSRAAGSRGGAEELAGATRSGSARGSCFSGLRAQATNPTGE